MSSTRTLHSRLTISVWIAPTSTGRRTISAPQYLPPAMIGVLHLLFWSPSWSFRPSWYHLHHFGHLIQVSHQSFRLVWYLASLLLITSPHILNTFTHISPTPGLLNRSLIHFKIPYPVGHSGPLDTSFFTLIYYNLARLQTVSRQSFRLTWYPLHSPLSCLFLPSRFWAFHSPLSALKSLTWSPDIFPRTHWSQWHSTFLAYHLCFDCPHKRRSSDHLRITMPASVIHKTSALLGCNVWALVTIAITTLASLWESNLFHLVHSPYHQPFPRLSGLDAASKTQRPSPDRTLGKKCRQRLRPCRVGDNKMFTFQVLLSALHGLLKPVMT